MIEISPKKTRQILLTGTNAEQLKYELERAFIELDMETSKGMYSPTVLKKKYPIMVELFNLL